VIKHYISQAISFVNISFLPDSKNLSGNVHRLGDILPQIAFSEKPFQVVKKEWFEKRSKRTTLHYLINNCHPQ